MDSDRTHIPMSRPFLWGNELDFLARSIGAGEISGNSGPVTRFECAFAEVIGRRHAVSASSGTAALQLLFASMELPPKSKVIVPAFCMMAPVFAVVGCGLRVTPVDVDESWNMNPARLREAIGDETSAILIVQNYGLCLDSANVEATAAVCGLPIVEDAAEAFGAQRAGRQAGTLGVASCFSFYANKVVTTGEGGMVVTDSDDLARGLRKRRNLSFGANLETQYEHDAVGSNYRMSALQASFGQAQLEHAAAAIESKRRIGLTYRALLEDDARITLQPEPPGATHAFWAVGILLVPELEWARRAVQEALARDGIETRRFFAPVHSHAGLSRNIVTKGEQFPVAERLYRGGICLPTFIGMSEAEIVRVCAMLKRALDNRGARGASSPRPANTPTHPHN